LRNSWRLASRAVPTQQRNDQKHDADVNEGPLAAAAKSDGDKGDTEDQESERKVSDSYSQ
jgi:hypothetical protein